MDAYRTALTLLSRRELSTKQLRERLARKQFDDAEIDAVVQRLTQDRTLDDRRVALASARLDAAIKRRGRRRVLQHVRQLGVSATIAEAAVNEVFGELDENALLERALERRLKGANPRLLDRQALARVVRSLVGQGFDPGQVYARLRRKSTEGDE